MTFARLLMTSSALVLALLGLPCLFAPEVLLVRFAGSTSPGAELIVQITGALYLGFAILNWMAKGSLIGGIYGRPVALGNLLHFVAAGLALFRAAASMPAPLLVWAIAAVYALLAIGFARVMFGSPFRNASAA